MEQPLLQYKDIEDKIFLVDKTGKVFIGGDEVKADMLDVLRTQAYNLKSSELYEVFRATIINEAYNLALKQSANFDNVQFAKALYHWEYVLDNILLKLSGKLDK
jgi:hypothetical protein